MKLSVILPAYNEERSIRFVLDAVLGACLVLAGGALAAASRKRRRG